MNQPKTRKYVDVNGLERSIELVEEKSPMWFTRWITGGPPSTISRWKLEDGSVIQIPDDAWTLETPDYSPPKML